jgi:hypothetical protein
MLHVQVDPIAVVLCADWSCCLVGLHIIIVLFSSWNDIVGASRAFTDISTHTNTQTHTHTHDGVLLMVVLEYCLWFMQMAGTSSWEWMSPDVVEEVMDRLKWDRRASAVFRRVCKRWRDAHDQCVRRLTVQAGQFNSDVVMSRFISRFQRVREIHQLHGDQLYRPAIAVGGISGPGWFWALAGLTALTRLKLAFC